MRREDRSGAGVAFSNSGSVLLRILPSDKPSTDSAVDDEIFCAFEQNSELVSESYLLRIWFTVSAGD